VTSERPVNRRLEEDLRFEAKPGGSPRYSPTTGKPVQYLTVADKADTVIGYVWANDEDDAAGWEVRKAGGDDAFNKGARWARKLHDAKARELAPTDLLAELARGTNDSEQSHAVPGSLAEAPTLAALREMASRG
jgi:hypothetical protein